MKKNADIIAFSAVGLALIAAVGYPAWPHIQTWLNPHAPLIAECEAEIMDRLIAPSTYQRLADPVVSVRKASLEEAVGPLPANADAARKDLHAAQVEAFEAWGAWLHQVKFDYEASNAAGVPIREVSFCREITRSPEPPTSPSSVEVDGETGFDRALRQIRDG